MGHGHGREPAPSFVINYGADGDDDGGGGAGHKVKNTFCLMIIRPGRYLEAKPPECDHINPE